MRDTTLNALPYNVWITCSNKCSWSDLYPWLLENVGKENTMWGYWLEDDETGFTNMHFREEGHRTIFILRWVG